jgi:uncharacterized repeat protein (TIGR01451 family)
VPAGQPFDVRVFWNEPALQAGETWYGAFSLGTDAANPGNLGTIFVNVIREADDVVKGVLPDVAAPGDTVTYQIVVNTNVTPEDLAYTIQDTIPAGLTYVDGSASASTGTVEVTGNTLTWTGVMPPANSVQGGYTITSNQTDPACATPFGGYFDSLTESGGAFTTDPGLSGDTFAWSYNSFAGTDFYGTARAAPSLLTDDGIVVFGEYAGEPWVNQSIPDPTVPNSLLAPYWRDLEVVYDEAANKGVTAVTFDDGYWLVEFDDIQAFQDPTTTLDFEVIVWRDALPTVATSPDLYDAYYAYDNINVADTIGTIGVENDAGDAATQFSFDNFTPTNGLVLCLDYVGAAPAVITYDVTVNEDAEGVFTNAVVHNTDNPGSQPATASADLHIVNRVDTTTTISSDNPDPSVVGQAVTVHFNVTANPPGAGTPTGNVMVSDGTISCTGTVAEGQCSLTFTSAGARSLTATYEGDSNFNGSTSAAEPHTVNLPNSAPTATVTNGQCSTTNMASGTINLTLNDPDPGDSLTLTLASNSNPTLVPNSNIVLGGSGNNRTLTVTTVAKGSGSATITLNLSDGTVTVPVVITVKVGGDKNETLNGSSGIDMIFGLGGKNTINGNAGNDLLCGGNGVDTISGGDGNDIIDGANGDDVLKGEAGDDILRGAAGNDTLNGGDNDDVMSGGSGADAFSSGSGTDSITDFTPSQGDRQDGTIP